MVAEKRGKNSMSDGRHFTSKFAGRPGSLTAARITYPRNLPGFEALAPEDEAAVKKREVRRFKQGHRLGDPMEWNASTYTPGQGGHPERPLMHRLSEFQAVRMEYNYRSQTLPDVNKKTIFIPKPSKMEFDRSMFVAEKDKGKLVDQCPATVTKLSSFEINNDPDQIAGVDREGKWNCSVQLDEPRTNIFKSKDYDDFRDINKSKRILDHDKYVPPQRRQAELLKNRREDKLAEREAKRRHDQEEAERKMLAKRGGTLTRDGEPVFKMSNIDLWWNKHPPELAPHLQALREQDVAAVSPTSPTEGQRGGHQQTQRGEGSQ